MIFTFTDFGLAGPYLGQVKAVLWRHAPATPIFDLFADAPDRNPFPSAYLLAAYAMSLPAGALILGVVDPGVGGARPPVALKLDGRWFVGPGNGLFEIAMRQSSLVESYLITEQPEQLSATFHGRDLFAPVVGRLATGLAPKAAGLALAEPPRFPDWPDDLAEIVYRDIYGNLMTGLRPSAVSPSALLRLNGKIFRRATTFSDVEAGAGLWYVNSNGLVEIAVNGGQAGEVCGAAIGAKVEII